jgi:hypothetical protein
MHKDEDIEHSYNKFLFMFLILKWKYDSIVTEYKSLNIILIAIHWYIMLQQKLWVVLLMHLIFGHILAVILVGNHEREKIFEEKSGLNFIVNIYIH